jgi:hypothetical protein
LIAEDGVEFCYRAIDNKDRFGFLDCDTLATPPSSILFVLRRTMPKPVDDIVNFRHPCQFAKLELIGGRQYSFACGGERHRALKVATPQMLYGRVYLAHRRVSDASFDMVRIAYGIAASDAKPLSVSAFTVEQIPYLWPTHGIVTPVSDRWEFALDRFGDDTTHEFAASGLGGACMLSDMVMLASNWIHPIKHSGAIEMR